MARYCKHDGDNDLVSTPHLTYNLAGEADALSVMGAIGGAKKTVEAGSGHIMECIRQKSRYGIFTYHITL